jgi:hypothetical protein
VRPNWQDSQSQWKETTMLSGYNHKWPKKLNFQLGQPKRLAPFCQMGSVRKDANLCKLPLHLCMRISTFFFPWLFKHGYHRTCSYWSYFFSRHFKGMLVIAQGGLGRLKPKEGPLYWASSYFYYSISPSLRMGPPLVPCPTHLPNLKTW